MKVGWTVEERRLLFLNQKNDIGFDALAQRLGGIADEIANLIRPGLLDVISLASPFYFDEEDDEAVQLAIEKLKSMSGLGPYQEPLGKYLETCVEVDNAFTQMRCRTDRRAKRFLTLQKQLDALLNGKISPEIFVLRIREQIALLRSLHEGPPKKASPSRKKKKDTDVHQEGVPEGIREFLIRKLLQSIILSVSVGVIVLAFTFDQNAMALATLGCVTGVLVGVLFEFLYYAAFKDTSLRRAIAYVVLAAYVFIFLLIAGFYLSPLRIIIGYYTDVLLLIVLLVTELIARWGPLDVLERIADYIWDGLFLVVFFIIAQIVSVLIGQTVWVAISVISAFYTIWDRRRKVNDE